MVCHNGATDGPCTTWKGKGSTLQRISPTNIKETRPIPERRDRPKAQAVAHREMPVPIKAAPSQVTVGKGGDTQGGVSTKVSTDRAQGKS